MVVCKGLDLSRKYLIDITFKKSWRTVPLPKNNLVRYVWIIISLEYEPNEIPKISYVARCSEETMFKQPAQESGPPAPYLIIWGMWNASWENGILGESESGEFLPRAGPWQQVMSTREWARSNSQRNLAVHNCCLLPFRILEVSFITEI